MGSSHVSIYLIWIVKNAMISWFYFCQFSLDMELIQLQVKIYTQNLLCGGNLNASGNVASLQYMNNEIITATHKS